MLAYTAEKLLKTGAIDVWMYPITMKKGRLAHCFNCICISDQYSLKEVESKLLEIIFRQTTTFGIRIHRDVERAALHRKFIKCPINISNKEKNVHVKVGMLGDEGEIVTYGAEYDDCKAIADECCVSVSDVSFYAIQSAKLKLQSSNM